MSSRHHLPSYLEKLTEAEREAAKIRCFSMLHDSISNLLNIIFSYPDGFSEATEDGLRKQREVRHNFRDVLDSYLRLSLLLPDMKEVFRMNLPWTKLSYKRKVLTHDTMNTDYYSTHRIMSKHLWLIINKSRLISKASLESGYRDLPIMHMSEYPIMDDPSDIFRTFVIFDASSDFKYRICGISEETTFQLQVSLLEEDNAEEDEDETPSPK